VKIEKPYNYGGFYFMALFNQTPDIEQMRQWKNEWKKLFKTTLVDGTILIWRRLKRSEYRHFMREYQGVNDRDERIWEREEAICRACILFPDQDKVDEIIETQAGIATLLSDDIFANSGFAVKEETEEIDVE